MGGFVRAPELPKNGLTARAGPDGAIAASPRIVKKCNDFKGRAQGMPTGQMPPYTAKVVSDTDMANIYAYVQSRTPPPAVQSIPLLREP